MEPSQVIVVVFAKPPVPGRVKTRLEPLVGRDGAARLAGAFLSDTLAVVDGLPWARVVLSTTGPFPRSWDGVLASRICWEQGRGDLGQRMERALARGLAEGGEAAIVLGADLPGITGQHLEAARGVLAEQEAVLSPSSDGGFYLVGLRRCPSGLFEGVPWSSCATLSATSGRFDQLGLSFGLGSPFFDIDEPDDLLRLELELSRGRLEAPATAAVLAETLARVPVEGKKLER